MTSPFITVADLVSGLTASVPPIVLDASFVLHPAKFDGDYRKENGRAVFEKSHIPGALSVDVSTQFSDLTVSAHYAHQTPEKLAAALAAIGIGENDAVVIYDSTGGMFAARLWYLLTWIGVDARVLDGGLAAWTAAGNPIQAGEPSSATPVAPWNPSKVREAWVTKDELAERSADDSRPLVCGLPTGSFTGADPTRYSRRGHIPGSVNVSSRDLFSADGTVKSASEVRAAYEAEGVTGADEVLLYCGGGISAAANALTLAELGITAVRLYDGSLEEWSADASLPLALG